MKCSACNGSLKVRNSQVYECRKCGGLQGSCYRGDVWQYVKVGTLKADCPAENLRYFDFTVLGSDGVSRVHGWYDAADRTVVQYG